MGLDQGLYRTSKKNFDSLSSSKKLSYEFKSQVAKLYSEKYKSRWESLPRDEYGDIDVQNLTNEQKDEFESMRKGFQSDRTSIASELNVRLDEYNEPIVDGDIGEEIGYWGKNWELHKYIIDNFWEDKEHDNVVDIPLTKENVEQIINWCTTGDNYDDYTEEIFKEALNAIEQGDVIYYHPWY